MYTSVKLLNLVLQSDLLISQFEVTWDSKRSLRHSKRSRTEEAGRLFGCCDFEPGSDAERSETTRSVLKNMNIRSDTLEKYEETPGSAMI